MKGDWRNLSGQKRTALKSKQPVWFSKTSGGLSSDELSEILRHENENLEESRRYIAQPSSCELLEHDENEKKWIDKLTAGFVEISEKFDSLGIQKTGKSTGDESRPSDSKSSASPFDATPDGSKPLAISEQFERSKRDFLSLNVEIQKVRSEISSLNEELSCREEFLSKMDKDIQSNNNFIRNVEDRLPEKSLLEIRAKLEKNRKKP